MKKKSKLIIIWHSISGIILIMLMLTAVGKDTSFNKHKIENIILDLSDSNKLDISSKMAYKISDHIQDDIFTIHYYFGIAFFFIVLLQIYTMIKYKSKRNFNIRTKKGFDYTLYLLTKLVLIYEAFTGIGTYIFYILNGEFKIIKEIHGIFLYPLIAFTILHISLVTYDTIIKRKKK